MHLPNQSRPVQRTLVGRPYVDGSRTELTIDENEQAMRGGEFGVQPSGFNWESLIPIATNLLGSFL
jgi:hypothetical protein